MIRLLLSLVCIALLAAGAPALAQGKQPRGGGGGSKGGQGHQGPKKGQGKGGGKGAQGAAGEPGAPEVGALGPKSYPEPGDPTRGALPPCLGEEEGVYPTFYPPADDPRADPGVVHEDSSGGADQALLALSGAVGGGFAGVFEDQRKGSLGLYLARLDSAGERLLAQLPLSDEAGTARELLPAVAAAADGAGALSWMRLSGLPQTNLRFFAPEREAWTRALPLGSGSYRERIEGVEAPSPDRGTPGGLQGVLSASAPSLPAVALRGARAFVAWREGELIYFQTCLDGIGERVPGALNLGGEVATGRVAIAVHDDGTVLVAWETEEGIGLFSAREQAFAEGSGLGRARTATGGHGRLRKVLADPRGGFWLLVEIPPGLVLRHASPEAAIDGSDLPAVLGAFATADAATSADGIAVLAERISGAAAPAAPTGEPEEPEGPEMPEAPEAPEALPAPAEVSATPAAEAPLPTARTLELFFFTPAGERVAGPPLSFEASVRARGAFLAGEGAVPERLLLAWNDDREANGDVYRAFLERGPEGPALSAPARWNDDEVSSDQTHAACASLGTRAVVAWEDARASDGQVFFRLLRGDGAWLGGERPAAGAEVVRDRGMHHPEVAMAEDGRFLIAWCESAAPGEPMRLRAQAFGEDGEPLAPPVDVDPGFELSADDAPAVGALERDQGYAVAWIRSGEGPRARRLSMSGAPVGDPVRLSDRAIPTAANVALAHLSPRQLVCAWDEAAGTDSRVLTGRFLGPDVVPAGEELDFDWSGAGGDTDPELAPSGDGGFVVTWTGRGGPASDVLARFYAEDGSPAGPPLALSALEGEQSASDVARLPGDEGWIAVWQDDLPGVEQALARRIAADRTTLGDVVELDPQGGEDGEVRQAPRAAALGAGFAALWVDCARSQGRDVALRAFGPGFDADRPPPEHPDPELAAADEPEDL